MTSPEITTAILTFITGGGLVTGIVALRKDRRDSRQEDLDYTKEFREIAKEEVRETRAELAQTQQQVKHLEERIGYLEQSVRLKDHIIHLLVEYVGLLRNALNKVNPPHPLPIVPTELKDYIKE